MEDLNKESELLNDLKTIDKRLTHILNDLDDSTDLNVYEYIVSINNEYIDLKYEDIIKIKSRVIKLSKLIDSKKIIIDITNTIFNNVRYRYLVDIYNILKNVNNFNDRVLLSIEINNLLLKK